MKNIFIIFLLLIFLKLNYGQENTCRLNNDYFLIGTLTDYMGREIYKKVEDRVDTYYKYEKALACAIDSLYIKEYPDLKLISNQETGGFEIYSNSLAESLIDFLFFAASCFLKSIYISAKVQVSISSRISIVLRKSALILACNSLILNGLVT